MTSPKVEVKRIGPTLYPDSTRVLMRPFFPVKKEIARRLFISVLSLSNKRVEQLYEQVFGEFADRHEQVERFWIRRFLQVQTLLDESANISKKRQAVIGAYFSHEYSPESAALFNPSIVRHPDQTGLPANSLRFILSLRATGEGHISSITFRTGIVNSLHRVLMNPPVQFVAEPEPVANAPYQKALFSRKLQEAGLNDSFCQHVTDQLNDSFILKDLHQIIKAETNRAGADLNHVEHAARGIMLLAESNHEVRFDPHSNISQRILFPSIPSERNGIEDARFVRFREDDGKITFYATYTAYDGRITLPQLLVTEDFVNFKFITLNGPAVQNKGMALFPKRIDGRYAMLSRQDDENILLMYSENIHFWHNPQILLQPHYPWEMIKIGTCGSPIETEAGWLVLSHGVGAMRKYCLGAFLLDLQDPSRVLGRLSKPLMSPNESEREGYVPNVIYTCGALRHGQEIIIPYAMSDFATSFVSVNLDELLKAML